jgi:hypothetical protein
MNYSIDITQERVIEYTKPEDSTAEQDLFAIALLMKCVVDSLDTYEQKQMFISGIKKFCSSEVLFQEKSLKN